jgi:hypothetical protein
MWIVRFKIVSDYSFYMGLHCFKTEGYTGGGGGVYISRHNAIYFFYFVETQVNILEISEEGTTQDPCANY